MCRGNLVLMGTLTSELEYPMVIVTAAAAGERSGCLVGFHTQCSIHPLHWAVWISIANHTHGVASRASWLAVHFPSKDDEDLAALFGEETGDDVDKFANCEWTEGPDGVPILDRLRNRLVGRIGQRLDAGGDHECFVLRVDEVDHADVLQQLGFQSVRGFEPGHPA